MGLVVMHGGPGVHWGMLDERTRSAFDLAERHATQQGIPLAEALERFGLLVTDLKERQIAIRALEILEAQLEEQPATAMASLGGNQTIAGAVAGCLKFIRFQIETWERINQT